jgi:hypothetical protein
MVLHLLDPYRDPRFARVIRLTLSVAPFNYFPDPSGLKIDHPALAGGALELITESRYFEMRHPETCSEPASG